MKFTAKVEDLTFDVDVRKVLEGMKQYEGQEADDLFFAGLRDWRDFLECLPVGAIERMSDLQLETAADVFEPLVARFRQTLQKRQAAVAAPTNAERA